VNARAKEKAASQSLTVTRPFPALYLLPDASATIRRIQHFSEVINPKANSQSLTARIFRARPLLFSFLLLAIFSVLIWPSR
jgi:hypothetical protein